MYLIIFRVSQVGVNFHATRIKQVFLHSVRRERNEDKLHIFNPKDTVCQISKRKLFTTLENLPQNLQSGFPL